MPSVYDFQLPGLTGETIDLEAYEGRPILIVNTASKCGFTTQYEELQHLWSRYGKNKPEGLVVVGVPSGQFGNQELSTAQEIGAFCQSHYGVSFPMAAKSVVRGPDALPLFRWLRKEGGLLSVPRWNFYKYLIGRDGHLFQWFTPLSRPLGNRMDDAVLRVLLDH